MQQSETAVVRERCRSVVQSYRHVEYNISNPGMACKFSSRRSISRSVLMVDRVRSWQVYLQMEGMGTSWFSGGPCYHQRVLISLSWATQSAMAAPPHFRVFAHCHLFFSDQYIIKYVHCYQGITDQYFPYLFQYPKTQDDLAAGTTATLRYGLWQIDDWYEDPDSCHLIMTTANLISL